MRLKMAAMAAVAVTACVGASTASAQTNQSGLVNVNVQNNTVQVPIGVAANVCGVAANVLAQNLANGPADCTAIAGATATRSGGGGGTSTNQRGLVNLSITDNTIQIPVGIAANVCGVSVNFLAQALSNGGATCNALGNSTATGG